MNRVAIVTGGASGIGAAICRKLAHDGLDIGIWDWNIEPSRALADEITALGRSVIVVKMDVSKSSDISAGLQRVHEQLGPVSVLVNNAGISPEQDFVAITVEEWERVFDINMKGVFMCTQAVVSDMIAARWGRIINISSSSAQSGARRMVHYAATKGGVIGFTKALAQELGRFGITVNNIPPERVNVNEPRGIA
jgi:2-hydroxycyclohexanecarboxyl-CoA dehydrogenase